MGAAALVAFNPQFRWRQVLGFLTLHGAQPQPLPAKFGPRTGVRSARADAAINAEREKVAAAIAANTPVNP